MFSYHRQLLVLVQLISLRCLPMTEDELRAIDEFIEYIETVARTPYCEKLDIELPIFAFSHCRDVVAAVSKAGGFGVLGALAFSPDELEIELKWIDEHCGGKPYGVDIVMPATYVGKGGGEDASLEHLQDLIP